MKIATLFIIPFLVFFSACGDEDDTSEPHEETLEEHFCVHFEEGPFEDAVTSLDEAPNIAIPHTVVRLSLTESSESGNFTGIGTFAVENAGTVAIATGENASFAVENAAQEEQSSTEAFVSTGVCSSLAQWNLFELQVGTYAVNITSTEAEISILIGFP